MRICVSVPATTTTDAMRVIHGLSEPDLVELRLDYATEHIDLNKLRDSTGIPLIGTARIPSHGGRWNRDEGERHRLLLSAVLSDFDYIDVEAYSIFLDGLIEKAHEGNASVIVSHHYLDRTPPLREILDIHGEAKKAGADIVKVVGTAINASDNLPYLEYLGREPGNISFAMGALGVPSRVFSPLMGGVFTYASFDEGGGVAPGQLTLTSLREIYRQMGVIH